MAYKEYLKLKREAGVSYKTKKNIQPKLNGRSADYVMSAPVVGCEISCQYCYISRHRPFGNPVEKYINLEEILQETKNHFDSLTHPKIPNQTGTLYTYDVCEGSDALSGVNIEMTNRIISFFIEDMKDALCTFATKLTNYKGLRRGNYKNTRVRLSLMPESVRQKVEFGTATTKQRIDSIKYFFEKGYEVHVNFSPVILTPNWISDYKELFLQLDKALPNEIKSQLKAEVIFLTHHSKLNESNLIWNSEGEDLLWKPEIQKLKPKNNRGSVDIVNYKDEVRFLAINYFRRIVEEYLPYCFIRYIF